MIRVLRRILWPLCLAANTAPILAAAVWFPQLLSPVSASVTVLLLLLLVIVEEGVPYRVDWSVRGDPRLWQDVGHTLAYAALAVNATRVLFLGVLAASLSRLGLLNVLHVWPTQGPRWLQVVLIILIGDLLEYGYHRLSHVHPWLWRLHAIHHSPMRLSVVKGARHHFLYALGRGAMVWSPLLLLGAPVSLVYWQFIAVTIAGLPAHANIQFWLPRWLHRLAVTPDYHRIHHSADRRLGHSNFAAVFPLWDMVFGTHSDPLRIAMGEAGIEGDDSPVGLLDELKLPFTRVAAGRHLSNERV